MKKIVLIILIAITIQTQSFAESTTSYKDKKSGTITGHVIDNETKENVEYASVSLHNSKTKEIITGVLTNKKGIFSINKINPGKYFIKIDFIGYKTHTSKEIFINKRNKNFDLGDIYLRADADLLNNITVTVERTYIENKIDKKVVNIGKDLLTVGASATEIMNSLPSVDVDIEGNVSLRGNENVRILIDGRPSNLSAEELLETIPAESIEKVEIITNPSAKYDPDGISGILNIIIKQNKKLGFQGSVNAGIGSANNFSGINKYNGALNLSYKKGKWDILANYSYRENIRESSGDFVRTTITPIGGENILEQTSENERGRTSQTIKTGFGYSFSDKNKILYNANIRLSDGSSTNNLEYLSPMELKNTISETDFNTIRNDITYIHNFDNTSSIEINAYRNDSKNTGASVFATENTLGIQPNEKDSTIGKNSLTTAQADYNIETEDYKLEIGIKGQLRKIDSDYKYLTEDNSGNYIVDNNRSDHYLYDEKIFSTYTNYGKNWDKWSLQAGVRLEHVSTESGLIETEKYKSDNFNFYPSVFVVRKIGENNELGASYSKRVSRPSTRQLNPAKRFTDTLNIRMGNPYLNPEFTNSFELTFNSYWKGGSFNSAIFYRDILDKIQRVKLVDENGVSTTTYDNISNAQELGMEASVMTKLYDWWSINASANIYYSNLETDDPNYNNNGVNWFMKINNSFKMGKTWSLQASGKYTGKKIIPQGHIDPMYNMELGIQKSLFNKKATISFRLSDIFNTYKMTYYTTGSNFEEEGNRKWESRVAYLTFSYNFGDSMKNKKKGRKEGASEIDSEAVL